MKKKIKADSWEIQLLAWSKWIKITMISAFDKLKYKENAGRKRENILKTKMKISGLQK